MKNSKLLVKKIAEIQNTKYETDLVKMGPSHYRLIQKKWKITRVD